jgi:acyl-CoA synthetase (AMP-forming)/AMP-acid ligase II
VNRQSDNKEDLPSFATLVELLRWRALHQPDQTGYTFLADGDQQELRLTYKELDRRARHISAEINSLGAAGQPVLLVFPSGLDFIAAFFGCLYSGSIVVTAYPPRPNRQSDRVAVIIRDSGAKVIITQEKIRTIMKTSVEGLENIEHLQFLTIGDLDQCPDSTWNPADINADSLALIQYTSGSTAQPNGVMVSHGNILHNSLITATAYEASPTDICVGWLPMTHDMGLIGNMLQPLYIGCHYIFMTPEHFLVRPIRWLRAISKYQATASGGPNFAFDYCAQKIKPELRDELDLSHWDLAYTGAEIIRSETLERFSAAFAPCGFKPEAFYPCYGLAESTLFVTGGSKAALPVERYFNADALGEMRVASDEGNKKSSELSRALVGCGLPLLDQQVIIVDPETCSRCSGDQIGEIWISGPSVAKGYWRQSQKTEQVFNAYLKDSGGGPYLRSGDMGFIYDDELFISGRLKDLIIIAGANHFPADIEITVENCHQAVRSNCVGAISADIDGAERLIVIAEIDRHFLKEQKQENAEAAGVSITGLDNVMAAIRGAISRNHDLSVYDICFIRQSTIPKTSSAKIQRHVCRKRYLEGELILV